MRGLIAAAAILTGPAVWAQDRLDSQTAEVMAKAREAIGPISPEQARKACQAQDKQGEIVVCAKVDTNEFRVPSDSELDLSSRAALNTGVPRAPKFDGEACDIKRITCFGLGGKRDPMYFIDLASIPPTPKDSDAEKVANGEMSDR